MCADVQRTELPSRDPAGYLFTIDGIYHRAVSRSYLPHLQKASDSGLYEILCSAGLFLPHEESDSRWASAEYPKILLPEQLKFVSYPSEWSFSQLKDAALATLEIQRNCLERGLSLKDATPYNMQLRGGHMCLIDSLSFEIHEEGAPWKAYRQFCESFLLPLLWAARVGAEVLPAQSAFGEGIPLKLGSALLPRSSWFQPTALFHVHLHAKASGYAETKKINEARIQVPLKNSLAMVEGLRGGIARLFLKNSKSEWSDYYATCNYSGETFAIKKTVVESWVERIAPGSAWDLGANTGQFSQWLAARGVEVIAADFDHLCVDQLYQKVRAEKNPRLHPIRADLANPTPALGWANRQRPGLIERGGRRDLVLALALVHHLCLGRNISPGELGGFFRRLGRWVVVEFVPKDDPQSRRLLRTRPDIFDGYTESHFVEALARHGVLEDSRRVGDSGRTLYLFRTHE